MCKRRLSRGAQGIYIFERNRRQNPKPNQQALIYISNLSLCNFRLDSFFFWLLSHFIFFCGRPTTKFDPFIGMECMIHLNNLFCLCVGFTWTCENSIVKPENEWDQNKDFCCLCVPLLFHIVCTFFLFLLLFFFSFGQQTFKNWLWTTEYYHYIICLKKKMVHCLPFIYSFVIVLFSIYNEKSKSRHHGICLGFDSGNGKK